MPHDGLESLEWEPEKLEGLEKLDRFDGLESLDWEPETTGDT